MIKTRVLCGNEKQQIFLLFKLIKPIYDFDQVEFIETFIHAGKTYNIHYYANEIEIEEIIDDI